MCSRMVEGLLEIEGVRIWGITDQGRFDKRAPTVSFTHVEKTSSEIGDALAKHGVFVWTGNFYALELTEVLGLEPDGVLRAGVLHYNTMDEVDRFTSLVSSILTP